MSTSALAVQDKPSAIEKAENTQLALIPSAILDRENLTFFANMIEAADLIPKEKANGQLLPLIQRKSRVMAKICQGVAHGFDPMSSQQNLDIIDGKIGLNARGMSVKLARTGRYATRVEYLSDEGCKLAVLEKDDAGKWILKGYVEFNKDMASKAGLLGKAGDMYKKYGPDMYFARCMTRVCKRFAPETLDTYHVGYSLAKQEQPMTEAENQSAPSQIAAPVETETAETPEVGQEYVDQEYSGMPEVDAEFVETDESESDPISPLESLRANVLAALDELPKNECANVLKGKPLVKDMTEDELKALLSEITNKV